jgi:hypothetical protein
MQHVRVPNLPNSAMACFFSESELRCKSSFFVTQKRELFWRDLKVPGRSRLRRSEQVPQGRETKTQGTTPKEMGSCQHLQKHKCGLREMSSSVCLKSTSISKSQCCSLACTVCLRMDQLSAPKGQRRSLKFDILILLHLLTSSDCWILNGLSPGSQMHCVFFPLARTIDGEVRICRVVLLLLLHWWHLLPNF